MSREITIPEGVIPVVAAVTQRDGRFLVACRDASSRHGGLWEFPGGKLLRGEGVAEGLARELHEELAVTVERVGDLRFRMRDPGSPYLVLFFDVWIRGEPRALEHQALGWHSPRELRGLPLAPSDARFVREILPVSGPVSSRRPE